MRLSRGEIWVHRLKGSRLLILLVLKVVDRPPFYQLNFTRIGPNVRPLLSDADYRNKHLLLSNADDDLDVV